MYTTLDCEQCLEIFSNKLLTNMNHCFPFLRKTYHSNTKELNVNWYTNKLKKMRNTFRILHDLVAHNLIVKQILKAYKKVYNSELSKELKKCLMINLFKNLLINVKSCGM